MRIISGEVGGRRIKGVSKGVLRPTTERVKEALFNILGEKVRGALVLDLYAGTGNLGLEALSRGAEEVTFVDLNQDAIQIIRENLRSLNYTKKARIYRGDALLHLKRFEKRRERFDLIFADPPYLTKFQISNLKSQIPLTPEGLLVLQHYKKNPPELGIVSELKKIRERRFGETVLSFYILHEAHSRKFEAK